MNIDFQTYQGFGNKSDWVNTFNSRRAFWPELRKSKDWLVANKTSFTAFSTSNFWPLSRQYYLLAWSLFTQGHPNQLLLPYKDNIGSVQDKEHQTELRNLIAQEGWGFVQFTGLAHLSCELGLKSILLHTRNEMGQIPGFRKTHDLEELLDKLEKSIRNDIYSEFDTWSKAYATSLPLSKIVNNSGIRFTLVRYGEFQSASPEVQGLFDLCRFIHTKFN